MGERIRKSPVESAGRLGVALSMFFNSHAFNPQEKTSLTILMANLFTVLTASFAYN